jgi:hypothetical protein
VAGLFAPAAAAQGDAAVALGLDGSHGYQISVFGPGAAALLLKAGGGVDLPKAEVPKVKPGDVGVMVSKGEAATVYETKGIITAH